MLSNLYRRLTIWWGEQLHRWGEQLHRWGEQLHRWEKRRYKRNRRKQWNIEGSDD